MSAAAAASETTQSVGSDGIVAPTDVVAGFAASVAVPLGALLRSIVFLPRVSTSAVKPNLVAALDLPSAVVLPVVLDAAPLGPTTERRSSRTSAVSRRVPKAIGPLPTDELPGMTPTLPLAPGGASAPPAGGGAGTFADSGAGARAPALPSLYLSQASVEARLPDGRKVTLAIDRPG